MDILIVVIIVLSLLFSISFYYMVKFGLLLLKLEDVIEESLDDLEKSEKAMLEILKKDIFFDSVEVRSCIAEIKNTMLTINKIALRLTSIDNNNLNRGEINNAENSREKESIKNN